LTGRANYKAISDALGYDFVSNPEDLELPGPACFSAAWFWDSRNLNALADIDAFEKIVRKVNGGINGMADRLNHWVTARQVLNVRI
jgi:putative chitinase